MKKSLTIPRQTLWAIVRREATTTRHNRFVQFFALVLLTGSGAAAALANRPETAAYGILLLFLYVIPLFGLLVGVSAALEDHEERPFLLSQPVPRQAYILGKAGMLGAALTGVVALTLLPAFLLGSSSTRLPLLGFLGLALVLVSVSSGLAIGYHTPSRSRGLMAALLGWFTAFGLYDILALGLSSLEAVQETPLLWVAALLLNPIDAVRLAGLFGLEQVPFSLAGAEGWIEVIITWLPLWVGLLTVIWTTGMIALACRRLHRG